MANHEEQKPLHRCLNSQLPTSWAHAHSLLVPLPFRRVVEYPRAMLQRPIPFSPPPRQPRPTDHPICNPPGCRKGQGPEDHGPVHQDARQSRVCRLLHPWSATSPNPRPSTVPTTHSLPAPGPRWASMNLGIFLCLNCSGIHRRLGVHISKVKSVTLDGWKIKWAQVQCRTPSLS